MGVFIFILSFMTSESRPNARMQLFADSTMLPEINCIGAIHEKQLDNPAGKNMFGFPKETIYPFHA